MPNTLVVTLLAAMLAPALAQNAPGTAPRSDGVAAPSWKRVLTLDDGRRFVSDGAFTLDVAIAKPAKLPADDVGKGLAKVVGGYLSASLPNAVGLNDLARRGAHYGGPGGVLLHSAYVDYLRSVLPARQVTLRMNTMNEPVVVVRDGTPVGLVMPMMPPQ